MGQLRDMIGARLSAVPGSPTGNAETISVTGDRLDVAGWAYDPDVPTAPIDVGFSVDGEWVVSMRANLNRPDVGAAFPAAGPAHGFRGQSRLSPGRHTVCVVFGNAGATGANTWHTCKIVTTTNVEATYNPLGNAEVFTLDGRFVSVTGWSVDPDALTSALEVHVHIDGQYAGSFPSGAPRDDIAAQYPGAGRYHGWYWRGAAPTPGPHQVCIYAINRNRGTQDPQMGCSTLTFPNSAYVPSGNLESATVSGRSVVMKGWTFDPDTPTDPVQVHFHIDGRYAGQMNASASRPDVAAAFTGVGPNHGFTGTVGLSPGHHTVCAYAINRGAGQGDPGLGCSNVYVDVTRMESDRQPRVRHLLPRRTGRRSPAGSGTRTQGPTPRRCTCTSTAATPAWLTAADPPVRPRSLHPGRGRDRSRLRDHHQGQPGLAHGLRLRDQRRCRHGGPAVGMQGGVHLT